MQLYKILLFGFITSSTAAGLAVLKWITMWFDAGYVESLHLPTDGDSLGIPIFSAFFFGIFAQGIIITLYTTIAVILATKHKLKTVIHLHDANPLRKPGRITKFIILGITLFFVGSLYFPPFYEYVNLIFLFTDTLSCIAGLASGVLLCLLITGIMRSPKPKTL